MKVKSNKSSLTVFLILGLAPVLASAQFRGGPQFQHVKEQVDSPEERRSIPSSTLDLGREIDKIAANIFQFNETRGLAELNMKISCSEISGKVTSFNQSIGQFGAKCQLSGDQVKQFQQQLNQLVSSKGVQENIMAVHQPIGLKTDGEISTEAIRSAQSLWNELHNIRTVQITAVERKINGEVIHSPSRGLASATFSRIIHSSGSSALVKVPGLREMIVSLEASVSKSLADCIASFPVFADRKNAEKECRDKDPRHLSMLRDLSAARQELSVQEKLLGELRQKEASIASQANKSVGERHRQLLEERNVARTLAAAALMKRNSIMSEMAALTPKLTNAQNELLALNQGSRELCKSVGAKTTPTVCLK